jgi:hypothetical protein
VPDRDFELDVFRDLLEEARSIGQLAEDENAFREAYEGFRAGDVSRFQAVLKRLGLRCSLICEWIRIKECIFVCLQLCGPPKPTDRSLNPRELAEAIVRITSDERLVRQLAETVEKRDHDSFQRIVEQFKLGNLCHFFCHWLCVVRYRLICHWLCSIEKIERPDFARELQSAGQALRQLLEHKDSFDQAVAASDAGDAEKLGAVIQAAQLISFCHLICEWFCSWRCTRVCLILCRQFPLEPVRDEIREALAFAKAMQQLGQEPLQLERLSAAVGAGDAETYSASVKKLKLQRFCIQLCHWICFLRCRRFCIPVCPDPFYHPWFTHVGDFDIYGDIGATGLTNKAQAGHGGPNYGFYNCMSLKGLCPKYDPANPGEPMAYRFLFQPAGAPNPTPITGGFVCEVLVGSRYTFWNGDPFAKQSVRIRGTGTTSPTPPPFDGNLTPPDHFIVPDPQGWVTVDPMAFDGAFYGPLMGLASAVAFPGGDPAPGVTAGTAVPVANQKNGVHSAIIFEATRVSKIGSPPPDYTNQLGNIHINNWNEVNLIDLQEFLGPGATACSPLTNDLHILYTADHELMAAWFIDMVTSASIPGPAPVFPSGTGPRGGSGSDFHDISTWPTCSYLIRLHTRRSLTTGLIDDVDKWNFKTFCIGKKRNNN